MAKLTDRQVEYLLPVLNALTDNIRILQNRLEGSNPAEWGHSTFFIVENTAHAIAKDAGWVSIALGVLNDVERGEY